MNQNSILEKKIQNLKMSNILHSGIYFISIVIHLVVYFGHSALLGAKRYKFSYFTAI